MRKSGLHKQISSIFDGVTVPQNGILPEDSELSVEQVKPPIQGVPESDTQQEVDDLPDTSECDLIPVVQIGRPMPLPKSKAMSKPATKTGFSSQVKKAVLGLQKSSLDPRQKKAAMLVGILSLVFGVVLFVSLGGVGKTQAATATENVDQMTQSQTAKAALNWKSSNPLPQHLRNATMPVSKLAAGQQAGSVSAGSDHWIVKGILFSQNKPSAIINDQILVEGQVFNGVTIVKITKETVEFEINGKHWTQFVQR